MISPGLPFHLSGALLLAAYLLLGDVCGAWSQQLSTGTVAGKVVAAESDVPIAYTVVVLLPERGDAPLQSTLSGSDGDFEIRDVAPGTYRLRAEPVGFSPYTTAAFQLARGAVARQRLVGNLRPIEIEGLTVRSSRTQCLTGRQTSRDPRLAALWDEVRKGITTRLAFEGHQVYGYTLRQVTTASQRGRERDEPQADTVVVRVENTPAVAPKSTRFDGSTVARQEGNHLTMSVLDERHLNASEFLRSHCLLGDPQLVDGTWEVYFRPVRTRALRMDVRGSIRLDPRSFQTVAVTLEYLYGSEPFAEVHVDYGDVRFPGGMLRLPRAGRFEFRPVRGMRSEIESARGDLLFSDFYVIAEDPRG